MNKITELWKTKNGKIIIIVAGIVLICIACFIFGLLLPPAAPETPALDETSIRLTAEHEAWLAVTQTAAAIPTFTPTITNTPTPEITSTPSLTPTPSPIPSATTAPLFDVKYNGFYLVNVDIAPGVWKSNGSNDGCYWETTTATGDIINNHFGMSGGTAYISPDAFQVRFQDCGTWSYLQGP